MAYPPLGAPRRSRRRIITIILVLIAVTVFAVSVALRTRTERRDSIEYLAAVKTIADQQLGVAGSLADMLANLNELDRPDILERVADLDEEFRGLRNALDEQVVTLAVAEAHGFFLVATDSWGDGLAALDDAIVQIIDEEDDGIAGDRMLEDAFQSLRVGDRAYTSFVGVAAALDESLRSPAFPGFDSCDPPPRTSHTLPPSSPTGCDGRSGSTRTSMSQSSHGRTPSRSGRTAGFPSCRRASSSPFRSWSPTRATFRPI